MEPWRVCRPVVADSQHFDEGQDPDPHGSERFDPDSGSATLRKTTPFREEFFVLL
jgi:hypothetical protein